MTLLETQNVSVGYSGLTIIKDVTFTAQPGRITALLGENGVGKSTLIRAICGLHPVLAGTILLDGQDIRALAPEARARLGIALIPEGRRLFPGLTVAETLTLSGSGERVQDRRQRDFIHHLFPDLGDHLDRRAWMLSGGQQQMLAIARALMRGPRLILADEPVLGLAPVLAARVLSALEAVAASGPGLILAAQRRSDLPRQPDKIIDLA